MIAKLIVWGSTRDEAISRCRRALEEYRISGVMTTVGFHLVVLRNDKFVSGDISTGFLLDEFPDGLYYTQSDDLVRKTAIAVAIDMHARRRKISLRDDNRNGKKTSKWRSFHRERSLRIFRKQS